jgi:hypothetical protein
VHVPVWVQMKTLFQRECLGPVLGEAGPLVPHKMTCEETTCSSCHGLGTFPEFLASVGDKAILKSSCSVVFSLERWPLTVV